MSEERKLKITILVTEYHPDAVGKVQRQYEFYDLAKAEEKYWKEKEITERAGGHYWVAINIVEASNG